jgi:hypothetical protein
MFRITTGTLWFGLLGIAAVCFLLGDVSPVHAQPGFPPRPPFRPPGIPNPPMPGNPFGQNNPGGGFKPPGPLFETVWVCGKCGREVQRIQDGPPPSSCPHCGVKFRNGFGPANPPANGGPPMNPPNGLAPPADNNPQGPNPAGPNNPDGGAAPRGPRTLPFEPQDEAEPVKLPDPPPPASPSSAGSSSGSQSFTPVFSPKLVLGGLALVAALVLVGVAGAIVLINMNSNNSPPPRRRRRRVDDFD